MNRIFEPELLHQLASAYVLGTLRGGARRRLETLAAQDARIRRAIAAWQAPLSSLTELAPAVQPPHRVWQHIEQRIKTRRATVPSPVASTSARPWWHRWWPVWPSWDGWRGAALASTALAVVLGTIVVHQHLSHPAVPGPMLSRVDTTNTPRYVALLQDERAQPQWLVTYEPARQRLLLRRVGTYDVPADRSLQLWGIAPGATPRSLGVLAHRQDVLELAIEPRPLADVQTLAISSEPLGGVSGEDGPSGPVLFTGQLLIQDT